MKQVNIKIVTLVIVTAIYIVSLISYSNGNVHLTAYITGVLVGLASGVSGYISKEVTEEGLTYQQVLKLLIVGG